MRTPQLAPSILSADFARLGEDMLTTEQAGADRFHIDVMDGHFVPNITMGPVVVSGIRPVTALPFDVHLMISNPDQYLEPFAKAGANLLIPHIEAASDIHKTVSAIRTLGCQAGVAISPDTPIDALRDIALHVDLILVMSVYPGFSGQRFIEASIERVRQVRSMLNDHHSTAMVAVDGGVDPSNIGALVAAGADNIVAASSVYRTNESIPQAIQRLHDAIRVGS